MERAAQIYFSLYMDNMTLSQLNPGSNVIGLAKHDVTNSCNRESVDLSNGLTFGINIDAITDDAFLYFISQAGRPVHFLADSFLNILNVDGFMTVFTCPII